MFPSVEKINYFKLNIIACMLSYHIIKATPLEVPKIRKYIILMPSLSPNPSL